MPACRIPTRVGAFLEDQRYAPNFDLDELHGAHHRRDAGDGASRTRAATHRTRHGLEGGAVNPAPPRPAPQVTMQSRRPRQNPPLSLDRQGATGRIWKASKPGRCTSAVPFRRRSTPAPDIPMQRKPVHDRVLLLDDDARARGYFFTTGVSGRLWITSPLSSIKSNDAFPPGVTDMMILGFPESSARMTADDFPRVRPTNSLCVC